MPLDPKEISQLIKAEFPNAEFQLEDLVGDKNHFHLDIISEKFANKSKIQQHRMVHKALGKHMGNSIHALTITTRIK